jgi:hypothetical protein
MLEDVGFVARRRAAGGSGVWGDAGVDENVAAGSGLDEVAGKNHLHEAGLGVVLADGD